MPADRGNIFGTRGATISLAATVPITLATATNTFGLAYGSGLTVSAGRLEATGGGGGAPTDAQYLALTSNASLTQERVFTAGAGLSANDAGAGAAYTISIATAGVVAAMLGAGAVTNTAVAAGAVGTTALADGGVTSAKLAAGAVDTTALGAGAVTSAKIAAGNVDTTALANGAVTSAKLAVGAVDASALAAGAVTNTAIAANAVGATAIAAGAITSGKLAAGAVDTTALGAGAVTSAKIAAGAVDTTALGAGAVTSAKIAAGAVDTTALGAGAVTSAKIAAGNVDTTALQNNGVTFAKIQTVSTNTLLGRYDAGSGNVQTLAIGSGLSVSAGVLQAPAGGAGAPVDAAYVVTTVNGTLTNERRIVAGAGIAITDGGAGGDLTIATSGGSGARYDYGWFIETNELRTNTSAFATAVSGKITDLPPGAYAMRILLVHSGPTAADMKCTVAGTAITWAYICANAVGPAALVGNFAVQQTSGVGTPRASLFMGYLRASVTSDCYFAFAQNVAQPTSASATVLVSGSHMQLVKLA